MNREFYFDFPPLEPDNNGTIILIIKESIAPIEILTYSVTSNRKYYLEWKYPLLGDDELEIDYREISKERLVNDLTIDLNNCVKNENIDLSKKIKNVLDFIKQI